jgi:hypothetical protein
MYPVHEQDIPNLERFRFATEAVIIERLIKDLRVFISRVFGIAPKHNPKLPSLLLT